MKITPIEIRQKGFEKVFRGYDKDEVNAFLLSLSHEWEKLIDENKELKIKLEATEREVEKLREVENSLFKTLKTAEDTGNNMIQQANKAAELQLKETKMKSENIMSDTKKKAKDMIEKAETQAKDIVTNTLTEIKDLEQSYSMIMALKENLISELKNFTSDTLERVENFKAKKDRFNIDQHLKAAKDFAARVEESNYVEKFKAEIEDLKLPEIKKKQKETVKDNSKESKESGSFFDTIE